MERNHRERPSEEDVRKRYGGDPLNSKEKMMQLMVLDVLFDFSSSMKNYFADLIWCFNEVAVPSLLGASRKQVAAARIGAMYFSNKLVKPWEGFIALDEIKRKPLTKESYLNHPDLDRATALYQALIESMRRTDSFCKSVRGPGARPIRKIMALTDGANNCNPRNPEEVFQAVQAFKPGKNDMISLGFFKTDEGLSQREFENMARQIGATHTYYADLTKGKDLEGRRQDFRHHFKIFSSQLL